MRRAYRFWLATHLIRWRDWVRGWEKGAPKSESLRFMSRIPKWILVNGFQLARAKSSV